MGLCVASQTRRSQGLTPYSSEKHVQLIEDSKLRCCKSFGFCGGSQEQGNQGSTAYDIGKDVQEDKDKNVARRKSVIIRPEKFPSDINTEGMVNGRKKKGAQSWAHPKDAWFVKEKETVEKSRVSYSSWRLKEYQSVPLISTTFRNDPMARKVDLVSLMSSDEEGETGLAHVSGFLS